MIGKQVASNKIGVEVAISDKMINAIELWGYMYINEAPWLSDTVKSLNLSSAIASELARLVTIEFKSEVTGSARADYLNEQYQVVIDNIRKFTEYGVAKGGLVFKPYVNNDNILVDTVQADCFFPTAFDGKGNITSAIFVEQKTIGKKYYTRLEYHSLNGTTYTIQNKAYISDSSTDIGRETTLESVDEWATLQPEVTINNIEKPLFAYFKVPQANTIDTFSPLGVSIYSRAVNLICEADKQYSRLLWEFEGGELAVHADITVIDAKGETPKLNKRLFKGIENGDSKLYEVFSPALRDANFINGLHEIFSQIELVCGLSKGFIASILTGENYTNELNLKMSMQRTLSTVLDTQKSMQTALEQLLYAMDVLATLYNLAPIGKYEPSFDWKDSIVEDTSTEFGRRMQLVTGGYMEPAELMAWYFNKPIDEAKKMIPKQDPAMFEENGGV